MTKKAPRCPLLLVYMQLAEFKIVIVASDAHAHATRTLIYRGIPQTAPGPGLWQT